MVNSEAVSNRLGALRTASIGLAFAGAALCLFGAFQSRDAFFQSYLFAFFFWFGIGIGCLGLLILHHLVSGDWGDVIRPMLEAGAMTLPWLALLFIPLLFGLHALYPWARPEAVAADPLLQHKHIYLNVPFFIARAAGFFLLWIYMARRLDAWRDPKDAGAVKVSATRSAPWLVYYFITVTLCLLDWGMSLEPHWYSTIYEVTVIAAFTVETLAFLICLLVFVGGIESTRERPAKVFNDLGNMVLASTMFWAYTNFSQYLLIWSGNMPEEIAWYLRRQQGAWFYVELALVIFQFAIPFVFLLGRANKVKLQRLVWIARLLLAILVVDIFWLVRPPFAPAGMLSFHWLDVAAFVAVGAAWMTVFLGRLAQRPVIGPFLGEMHA